MRPNKPGKTPKSWPGLYTVVEDDEAEVPRSPLITSADAFHFPANIHDWLPFPLVHLAPPPAGFDFNPISNRFVRDASRQPPHFNTEVANDLTGRLRSRLINLPLRPTFPTNAAALSAATSGPKASFATVMANLPPVSSPLLPLPLDVLEALKTITGDLGFKWFWEHKRHNPYSLEDMRNMRLPNVVSTWLNERVISGLTWQSITRLLSCPDLFPVGGHLYLTLHD
ncbi:uncharacterized protein MELLADRAFT_61165 [Melampsora larici-populina 98AG31]|uniref:Uncharacterized protein n=1 Tax=Melampsora larici-populina (strain 98AG31 / pathotype 3-4-7) TaxID=747676 RepID=F4RDU9_MELLP|nr:uncharacterized protein MELLADRAFT_61165 [Melampsora larici-populina 98AG31]EGG09546.1 hypothetical protein MELLADRAFT_61165 [Melampsora larici-populina 98AG31]